MVDLPGHPTRTAVDRAGERLRDLPDSPERDTALALVQAWRSLHEPAMRQVAKIFAPAALTLDPAAMPVQRLKRAPSIVGKLRRSPTMRLSRMQDIAGVRVVVSELEQAETLWRQKVQLSQMAELPGKDYVAKPKDSGYRGFHRIFHVPATEHPQGVLVELQLRTGLQHAWATAVETVETLLSQPLKSGHGAPEWREFFTLASAAIAIREERTLPRPCETYSPQELLEQLRKVPQTLSLLKMLRGCQALVHEAEPQVAASYFLLELVEGNLTYRAYAPAEIEAAKKAYAAREARLYKDPGAQVVLISAESVELLRAAYPNYFLEAEKFLYFLEGILGSTG